MTTDPQPVVWIDGDPLMEAIAAAVWERCEQHDSGLVVDDPRNIAAVAASVAVSSAVVQSAPAGTALRDRILQALADALKPRYGGPQHNTPGGLPLTATAEEVRLHRARPLTEAVMAVLPAAGRAAEEETDVDVVANRATKVIVSMGAEIRALTAHRDRYRAAWCSARERAQAYGEGILRVVEDRESYQQWLKDAEGQNAALLRLLAAEERDEREAQAHLDQLADELPAAAPAVSSVGQAAHTTRSAVLREAADAIDHETQQLRDHEVLESDRYRPCRDASAQLRRMADETPPAEAPDVVAAIVAALQERAGELSELAEEQMRPSLEERAQEWHEAVDVARRAAKAAAAAPATEAPTPFTPPAHYRRDDGVDCCVHTIPVGPDSCPACRELHDDEPPAVGAQQSKEARP